MDLAYNADHASLRESLRRLTADRVSRTVVRAALERSRYDADLWLLLVRELGLVGLRVPAEHGGEGFSLAETGIALQELGGALAPVPLLAAALAAEAILAAAPEHQAAGLLAPLLSGAEL